MRLILPLLGLLFAANLCSSKLTANSAEKGTTKEKKKANDAGLKTKVNDDGGLQHALHNLHDDSSSSSSSSSSGSSSSSSSHSSSHSHSSDSHYDSSYDDSHSHSSSHSSHSSHYHSSSHSSSSSSSSSSRSYSKSYVRDGPNHCRRRNCARVHTGDWAVRCDRVCDGGIRLKCKRVCKGSKRNRWCKERCKNHGDKYFVHRFRRRGRKIRHRTKYYNLHGARFECQARCRLRNPLVFCRKRCYKNDKLVSDRFVSYDVDHQSIHYTDTNDVAHPHIIHDMPATFEAPNDELIKKNNIALDPLPVVKAKPVVAQ